MTPGVDSEPTPRTGVSLGQCSAKSRRVPENPRFLPNSGRTLSRDAELPVGPSPLVHSQVPLLPRPLNQQSKAWVNLNLSFLPFASLGSKQFRLWSQVLVLDEYCALFVMMSAQKKLPGKWKDSRVQQKGSLWGIRENIFLWNIDSTRDRGNFENTPDLCV